MAPPKRDLTGSLVADCKVVRCVEYIRNCASSNYEVECLTCGHKQIYKGRHVEYDFKGCIACRKKTGITYRQRGEELILTKETKCIQCGDRAVEAIKDKPFCRECFVTY